MLPRRHSLLLVSALWLLAFASRAQTGGRVWTDALQTGPGVVLRNAWVDPRGATYVVGSVYKGGSLQGLPLLGVTPHAESSRSADEYGGTPSFIAKASPGKGWRWAQTANSAGNYAFFRGVVGDARGGLYATGYFVRTVAFSSTITLTTTSETSGFVARYDTAGTLLWVTPIEGAEPAIAVDSAGNATVLFPLTATTTLGRFRLQATNAGSDVVVARLDREGNWRWATKSTGSANEFPHRLAVDAQGNIYVTGRMQGYSATDRVARFGHQRFGALPMRTRERGLYEDYSSDTLDFPGVYFWAKLDRWGRWRWVRRDLEPTEDIVVSAQGDIYTWAEPFTGWRISRFNSAGHRTWTRTLTTEYPSFDLVLTPSGNPCLLGIFGRELQLDSVTVSLDSLLPSSAYRVGAVQLSQAGRFQGVVFGRGNLPSRGIHLIETEVVGGQVAADGRVTIVGHLVDSLVLGPLVLANPPAATPKWRPALPGRSFIAHLGPDDASQRLPPVHRGTEAMFALPPGWAGATVDVLDARGQVVGTVPAAPAGPTRLPSAALPAGRYTVRARTAERQLARALVVE